MSSLQRRALEQVLLDAPRATMVLDVGCGDGSFLSAVASSLPAARLVGIDCSKRALGKASDRLAGHPRVSLRDAAVEALPFPEGSFDLVLAIRSFHHWSDWRAGLDEVARVMHGDGVLVLADALAEGAIRGPILRHLAQILDGGRFVSAGDLDEMLDGAGLRLARRVPVPRSAGTLFVTVASPAVK